MIGKEQTMSHSNPASADEKIDEKAFQISFDSEGSCVRGWFYPAEGADPSPTAILLHGFPGSDQSPLDLGPAMMADGIHALAFNYRGTFGSEGVYLPGTSIADVNSALKYLRSSPEIRERINPERIALVGYSYGGGIAFMSAIANPGIHGVASIGGAYLCEIARLSAQDDSYRKSFQDFLQGEISTSRARSPGAEACIRELLERLDDYDPVINVKKLVNRDILIIGGSRDPNSTLEGHILPIYRALQNGGVKNLSIEIYDVDHSFEATREALARRVIAWMKA